MNKESRPQGCVQDGIQICVSERRDAHGKVVVYVYDDGQSIPEDVEAAARLNNKTDFAAAAEGDTILADSGPRVV